MHYLCVVSAGLLFVGPTAGLDADCGGSSVRTEADQPGMRSYGLKFVICAYTTYRETIYLDNKRNVSLRFCAFFKTSKEAAFGGFL